MANILGQLLIELGVNTAYLKEGFDKATLMSRQFSSDVKRSFSELGSAVEQLGSQFGGLGGAIGGALGPVSNVLGALGGSLGTVAGAAVGAVAAVAAVGVAGLGMAISFSQTAARLEELSQATGISVEELSLLANVGATVGIGVDQMGKALERMGRSAVASAQAAPTAKTAYRDLGIEVQNTDGTMRNSVDIFNDVAKAFAKMPDGPLKTAEAQKIFGRAGAELIPAMNALGGRAGELEGHFKALNAVVSGPTAEASAKLKENMTLMGAAFSGVENELTAQLVPALNSVAEEFVAFFEENQDGIKDFIFYMAALGKVVINVIQALIIPFKLLFDAIVLVVDELQIAGATGAKVVSDISHGHFGDAWGDLKAGGKTAASELEYQFSEAWDGIKSSIKGIGDVWTAQLPGAKAAKPKAQQAVTGPTTEFDFINKIVEALEQQAAKEETLATAIGKVSASRIEATAAATAQAAMEKILSEAEAKHVTLSDKQKEAAKARIDEAALILAIGQAVVETQKEFDKFTETIDKQNAALDGEMVAGDALERQWAKNNATLDPLNARLVELTKEYDKQKALGNERAAADLAAAIARLSAEYSELAVKVGDVNTKEQAVGFSKALEAAVAQTAKMREEDALLLSGNPFGKMEAEVDGLITKLHLSTEQAASLRAELAKQEAETVKGAISKTAGGLGIKPADLTMLKDEVSELQANKAAWVAALGGEQQYEAVLAKLLKEQADYEAKFGGFVAGAKAGWADFAQSVQTVGETMQKVVGEGLKGIGDNLTDMIVKGKANWQGLISSMESTLIKSSLNSLIKKLGDSLSGMLGGGGGGGFLSNITGALGLGGAGAKLGTQSNPMYVKSVDATGGGLIGGGETGPTSGGGSLFSDFMESGLIPGMATGGNIMPNSAYLVGEKGPELFMPTGSGTILPNDQMGQMAGLTIHQHWNIQTPDANSFQQSQPQIAAAGYRSAATAARRQGVA